MSHLEQDVIGLLKKINNNISKYKKYESRVWNIIYFKKLYIL